MQLGIRGHLMKDLRTGGAVQVLGLEPLSGKIPGEDVGRQISAGLGCGQALESHINYSHLDSLARHAAPVLGKGPDEIDAFSGDRRRKKFEGQPGKSYML